MCVFVCVCESIYTHSLCIYLIPVQLHNIQKIIPAQKLSFRTFFPKTQQYENHKITSKYYRFSKQSISERNYQNSIESISNPVLMYLNIFSDGCYS